MHCPECKTENIYSDEEICRFCKEEKRGGWIFVIWNWQEGKVLAYTRMSNVAMPLDCQMVAIKASKLREVCERFNHDL